MNYRVQIGKEAHDELAEAFWHIHDDSPANAKIWLQGLYDKIDSLESMPERCAFARENDKFEEELRQLVFHSHRIIFTIKGKTVYVMHIRHGARKEIEP